MADPAVEIRALGTSDGATYCAFFDNVAFADNPGWADCYCYFPHARQGTDSLADGAKNRAQANAMVAEGTMRGFLAYVDGQAVAWCNANVLSSYTIFDDDGANPGPVGIIACFVVAADHRRQGIATALLDAACAGFQESGIEIVEAYPRRQADSAADNHLGPLAMYLSAGFEVVGEAGESVRVRKRL